MLIRRPGAAAAVDVKLLDFGLAARTAAQRAPALEKDRERRWQNIRDVAGELRRVLEHPPAAAAVTTAPTAPRRSPWVVAGVIAATTAVAITAILSGPRSAPLAATRLLRLEIATAPTDEPSMALSPDGMHLAFVANRDRVPLLWVRRLDGADSRPLEGTEGARFPFWSPDNRSIAFFAEDQLKRIVVEGGTPFVVTPAPNGRGGDWNRDGIMLFARASVPPSCRSPHVAAPRNP